MVTALGKQKIRGQVGAVRINDFVPRPSIMRRSIYFALGVIALRLLLGRHRRSDLLGSLRNAGL